MPSDHDVVIPISTGSVIGSDPLQTVHGGGTRMVPMVPVGEGRLLPCIWRSHSVKEGVDNTGRPIRVHECLLLVGRDPLLTLRAEVDVDAWKQFGSGPVEW